MAPASALRQMTCRADNGGLFRFLKYTARRSMNGVITRPADRLLVAAATALSVPRSRSMSRKSMIDA
jgi:hypothetical protein